jgi:hypothetical protein
VPNELVEMKASDLFTEGKVRVLKGIKSATGYPFSLNEEQIQKMVYFFGARRLGAKARGSGGVKSANFTKAEQLALDDLFGYFGLTYSDDTERAKCYRMLIVKFKQVLDFLKVRPAFITKDLYEALKEAGYSNIIKSVVFVVDEHNQVVPRLVKSPDQSQPIPIAKMEMLMWDIQNTTLDKLKLIVDSITLSDIKKANLGSKSKAMRDLFAMFHMSRLNNKNPNQTLIGISINASEPKDKLNIYGKYINRNREEH